MLDTKRIAWTLGLFGVVTFLVCIAYGLIAPASLHMTPMLEQLLPGFQWLTPVGFAIGLFEAFLYGAYTGLAVSWLYNAVGRLTASATS